MKLKVTLTKRSNYDIDDLDFLTELDYLRNAKQKTTDFINNRVMPGAKDAYTKTTDFINNRVMPGAKDAYTKTTGRVKDAASATSEKAREAMNNLKNMLGGKGPGQVFQTIMDYLKGIPWLSHLGTRLRNLWSKIKKFGVRTPVSKTKSLSLIAVACIGFIASMVASWAYRIIFGKKDRFKKNSDKFKSQISKNWDNIRGKAESAMFIEELGEILREDENGGTFMSMASKALDYSKDKIKALWDACKTAGSKLNEYFKALIEFLKGIIDNVCAIFGKKKASTALVSLKNGTAPDDSLTSFYESIILEAQAHKLKEIKKKAKKKVAIKQAKAKRSLRGRI